ncbi:hypothetical protein PanWU01x14_221360 [Parasponia andersonii]|uniref:Uncharacterized protein n=1 Tax=Parasponia andersonii TaxID=3476 RepID=A0A2P5BPU7_PARAD|nr:hypothetical protein PanWU01x14_221360 [Parasponia andersonii]
MVKIVEGGDWPQLEVKREKGPLPRRHMGAEKSISRYLMGDVKVKYYGAF